VVPAEEALTFAARSRGLPVLSCGPVAAVFGHPPTYDDEVRAAVWHDRVVGLALETCSSVVPFRFGIMLESEAELAAIVSLNATELSRQLARFQGRVEMGLKVRLAAADELLRAPFGLDQVRTLAPDEEDRSERIVRNGRERIFEGCYLIPRQAVDGFWRALDGIRHRAPELPLLGSGPWAAYTFCDVPLRRDAEPTSSLLESR
jgi:hypothetical protein